MWQPRLLILALAVGCSGSVPADPGTDASAALTTQGGIEYRAETLVMESFPVQLRTRVHARNVSASPRQLAFPDGCVVLLRAYREGSSTVAWDQGDAVMCTGAFVEANLAPGETQTFETTTNAAAILGNSLPDGRYTLEAYLRPTTGEVTVEAGSADLAVTR